VEVVRVTGLDAVRALPDVRAVIPLSVGPGRTDDFHHSMIAAVLGTVPTPERAVDLWRAVLNTIEGEYR
jgi:hypothetical protein